jgi:hypothetical protein
MALDMSKYRKNSSFHSSGSSDAIKTQTVNLAIKEFESYLKYAPNSFEIYINDSLTPILGTFVDVSDLEIRQDTKWVLTSLNNKICAGDILTVNGKKWMCVYDKVKNTQNCFKVKIQPCNYALKIMYKDESEYKVFTADSYIMTFLTDNRELKQPFPNETGTTFVSVQYNDATKLLKVNDRIWLYDKAFEIAGIDWTNIDYYTKKGFIKYTARPSLIVSEHDDEVNGICDYYKYIPKTVTRLTEPISSVILTANKQKLYAYEKATISANVPVDYTFDGDNMNCTITNITDNGCVLNTGSHVGIIYVKAISKNNPNNFTRLRFVIS